MWFRIGHMTNVCQFRQEACEDTMTSSRLRIVKASILVAATLSFVLSVYLWFGGSKDQGLFVAIWVPSILSFGAFMLAGSGNRE
jgi:hypothetical protein